MDNIYDNIWSGSILDSKIIQKMECAKKDSKFDINFIKDGSDWTLLRCANFWNREELVRYLLSNPNINVNHRSNYNSTVLHFCEQVSILKLLLDRRDLDVNIQNNHGSTGLHRVCWWGCKALVKEYLLDARGDALIRDDDENTGWDIALREGCPDIAKIIGNSGYTPLLRIPNASLLHDIVRMIIEEYA